MLIEDLKDHYSIIREEVLKLPREFVSELPRNAMDWVSSESEQLKQFVAMYTSGKHGWLKGGENGLEEEWISWPLIWEGQPLNGNLHMCPDTHALLSSIEGIHVAGFSLLKGGTKISPRRGGPYRKGHKLTYYLGLDIPFGSCIFEIPHENIIEENGKDIIIKDDIPYRVQNTSNEERITLYIEIVDT